MQSVSMCGELTHRLEEIAILKMLRTQKASKLPIRVRT